MLQAAKTRRQTLEALVQRNARLGKVEMGHQPEVAQHTDDLAYMK
jgi:hypothetical protein